MIGIGIPISHNKSPRPILILLTISVYRQTVLFHSLLHIALLSETKEREDRYHHNNQSNEIDDVIHRSLQTPEKESSQPVDKTQSPQQSSVSLTRKVDDLRLACAFIWDAVLGDALLPLCTFHCALPKQLQQARVPLVELPPGTHRLDRAPDGSSHKARSSLRRHPIQPWNQPISGACPSPSPSLRAAVSPLHARRH